MNRQELAFAFKSPQTDAYALLAPHRRSCQILHTRPCHALDSIKMHDRKSSVSFRLLHGLCLISRMHTQTLGITVSHADGIFPRRHQISRTAALILSFPSPLLPYSLFLLSYPMVRYYKPVK